MKKCFAALAMLVCIAPAFGWTGIDTTSQYSSGSFAICGSTSYYAVSIYGTPTYLENCEVARPGSLLVGFNLQTGNGSGGVPGSYQVCGQVYVNQVAKGALHCNNQLGWALDQTFSDTITGLNPGDYIEIYAYKTCGGNCGQGDPWLHNFFIFNSFITNEVRITSP